ncbi:MAG: MMPL family transporter [Spirochaetales bacterium]|nr:MMPL family transporter [Spirochaetales bacterium]
MLLNYLKPLQKNPVIIMLLSAALLAFCIPGLSRISFTTDISDYFVDNDPVLTSQEKFQQLFDKHEFIAVLVESDDVFSRETLETIYSLGEKLMEDVPFAESLVSLSSVNPVLAGGLSFSFEEGRLVSTDNEIEEIRESFRGIESFRGSLFSDDMKQAWIIVNLGAYPAADEWPGNKTPQFAAGEIAYDTVQSFKAADGTTLTATGIPVYAHRKEQEMLQDFMKILVLGAIVSALMTAVILRNLQAIIGTLLVIFFSVASVFSFYGWIGKQLDNAFMSVPILLTMGLCIGYSVHISHFFSLYFRSGLNRKESVFKAVLQTWRPILFTVMTTTAAMMTFLFVDIEPIRWVGYTSAVCLILVYFLSMTMFPAVLSIGSTHDRGPRKITLNFEPVLKRISFLVNRYHKVILVLFILVTIVSLYDLTLVKVDFDAEKMMGLRLQHMKDQKRISDSSIGTTEYLDLTIELDESNFNKRDVLDRIEAVQSEIEELPLVVRTSSLTGTVKEFNRIFHRNRGTYSIPEADSQLRGLFNFFERISPELLRDWVTEDYSYSRIMVELNGFSSAVIEDNLHMIDTIVRRNFPEGSYFLSGSTYQMALMNQYVTRGLVKSIFLGLLIITVLMIAVFKSFRMGMIAMIPNLFPIIVCGGIMGYFKIPLEFVTMTVAPLIMGLAVDDTIHFISYMKKGVIEKRDYRAGINHSFRVVGTAISQTTFILCITFLVFTSSRINSLINMGILTFSGMLAAFLADIFITPILVSKSKPFGKFK